MVGGAHEGGAVVVSGMVQRYTRDVARVAVSTSRGIMADMAEQDTLAGARVDDQVLVAAIPVSRMRSDLLEWELPFRNGQSAWTSMNTGSRPATRGLQ